MELNVLSVPDCPNVSVLAERLAEVLRDLPDAHVRWTEVPDEDTAVRLGMHGSPTLLVDGIDPFAEPGDSASLSCRIDGVPSTDRIRAAVVGDQ